MSDPTVEPRINVWRDRIERSKKLRDKYFKGVKKDIAFFEGNHWGNKKVTLSEKPVINLIFAHIKTQMPFLYFQNPRWYCRKKGMAPGQVSAELAEYFLNYYANENLGVELKKHMRLAILDAYFSYGVIKTGYVGDFEVNPSYGEYNVLGQDVDGSPIYEKTETGEFVTDDEENILVNEAFYARRVDPSNMLFDTENNDNYFESGRYIIEEIVKPLQDIKDSKLYENTKDLKANFSAKPGYMISDEKYEEMTELSEDLERVTLYEIYDLEHDKLLVMAEGHDEFLRDEEMPDGIDGSPFSFLRYNESPGKIYPVSEIKFLKPINEEYNLGRAMIMTHAKRFGRKYGYKAETFSGQDGELQMEKFKDPEDGLMFEFTGEMPQPLADAPLDSAVYANFDQTKVDFREIGGSTEHDRGLVEKRKTAYEASQISKAAGIRKEDRKSLVEDFAGGIGNKLFQSMQANLTIEHAVQIAGEAGMEWANISRNEIVGEFNVGVEVGSSAPAIPEFEMQQMNGFMQTLVQFPPDLIMQHINFEGLIKNSVKFFNLLDSKEILNSPEKAQQIKQQMDQMRLAEKQKGGGGE